MPEPTPAKPGHYDPSHIGQLRPRQGTRNALCAFPASLLDRLSPSELYPRRPVCVRS
jgi:hypothetical protein